MEQQEPFIDNNALDEVVVAVINSIYPEFDIVCGRSACESLQEDLYGIFFGVYNGKPTIVIANYDTDEYHLISLTDYVKHEGVADIDR